jgi:ligand-binding sensor domain-containing protein
MLLIMLYSLRLLTFAIFCVGAFSCTCCPVGNAGLYSDPHFFSHRVPGWSAKLALVQNAQGILFVGNSRGLLRFDGVHWERIVLPNRSGVRALAMDSTSRVWVGAQSDLGYLKADAAGRLHFISLVNLLPLTQRNFEGVAGVFCVGKTVWFGTARSLFRWEANQLL